MSDVDDGSTAAESKTEWGLYIDPVGSTSWRPGDRFKLTAVKTQASRALEIPKEAMGSKDSWGFPRLLSRWQSDGDALILRGAYLPVTLTKI